MNKEEIMQLIKEKLEVKLDVEYSMSESNSTSVRVSLVLDGEEISADYISI